MDWIGQRVIADVRSQLNAHFLRLSLSFYNRTPTATLLSRMTNDVELLRSALTDAVASVMKDLTLARRARRRRVRHGLAAHADRPRGVPGDRDSVAALVAPAAEVHAPGADHTRESCDAPAGDHPGEPRGQGVRHGGVRDSTLRRGKRAAGRTVHAGRAHQSLRHPDDGSAGHRSASPVSCGSAGRAFSPAGGRRAPSWRFSPHAAALRPLQGVDENQQRRAAGVGRGGTHLRDCSTSRATSSRGRTRPSSAISPMRSGSRTYRSATKRSPCFVRSISRSAAAKR